MLRVKIIYVAIIISAGIILLSSCESNRWFQSEDKLKSKIQTAWNMVLIPAVDANNMPRPPEQWIFNEGKLYRLQGTPLVGIDTGNFSISTTLTKAFLAITDLQHDNEKFNATWEIIELDKGLMYIATDHDGSTGLKQKEFTEN